MDRSRDTTHAVVALIGRQDWKERERGRGREREKGGGRRGRESACLRGEKGVKGEREIGEGERRGGERRRW